MVAAKGLVRVRFAPSPTGHLHLGGLRTALFNALFARQHSGKLVLRIEDTDQTRLVPGAVESLQDILRWTGITFDEGPSIGGSYGPYTQSERLHIYQEHAEQLLENDRAYRCFCSAERLDNLRKLATRLTAYDRKCRTLPSEQVQEKLDAGEPHTIRLKVPSEGTVVVQDLVYGKVNFDVQAIDDQVLIKSTGFPTYHLANVVDDRLVATMYSRNSDADVNILLKQMNISHVIRGEEWLSSTAKHVLLYGALGWENPQYAHIPLLINTNRSKLSKRQDDLRVEELRRRGYLPQALVNFVSFLGWSSPNLQSEVYTSIDDIAADFSLESVSKAPATVDFRKLNHLNKQHQSFLLDSDPYVKDIASLICPIVKGQYSFRVESDELFDLDYIESVVLACKGTFTTLQEVAECSYFWCNPIIDSEYVHNTHNKIGAETVMLVLLSMERELGFVLVEKLDAEATRNIVCKIAAELNLKPGKIFSILRLCLTGAKIGPSMHRVLGILGKQRSLSRISAYVDYFSTPSLSQ